MSNLIHCDGPDCNVTRDPNLPDMRALGESPWVHVDQGDRLPALDFHDVNCLSRWADQHGGLSSGRRTTAGYQPCMCHGSQVDPHTKAQHQAYPALCEPTNTTVVDGL